MCFFFSFFFLLCLFTTSIYIQSVCTVRLFYLTTSFSLSQLYHVPETNGMAIEAGLLFVGQGRISQPLGLFFWLVGRMMGWIQLLHASTFHRNDSERYLSILTTAVFSLNCCSCWVLLHRRTWTFLWVLRHFFFTSLLDSFSPPLRFSASTHWHDFVFIFLLRCDMQLLQPRRRWPCRTIMGMHINALQPTNDACSCTE